MRYYTNVTAEQLHDRNAFAQADGKPSLDDRWMLKVQAKMNWASSAYRRTRSWQIGAMMLPTGRGILYFGSTDVDAG